jgi:hypothetical protein
MRGAGVPGTNPEIRCLQKGQLGSSRPFTVNWYAHWTHSPWWQDDTMTDTGRSMQIAQTPVSSSEQRLDPPSELASSSPETSPDASPPSSPP